MTAVQSIILEAKIKGKTLKRIISKSVVAVISGLLLLSTAVTLSAQEKITVRKMANGFVVRSEYSPQLDLVIQFYRFANEASFLLPKNMPLKNYMKGRTVHVGGDEYPATVTGSLKTLSGNHGSAFCRTLLIPNHGMTTADIGGKITEKSGFPYIIMQIVDKDRILIHPWGSGDDFEPRVRVPVKSPLLYKGKPLAFKKSVFTQMYPLNRVTDYRLLADGKTPVPDNTDVVCDFVDFIFVHDVISPNAAVRSVMENPGRKPSPEWNGKWGMTLVNTPELRAAYPEYMKLPAIATFSNRYRFEARGAYVLYRKVAFHSRMKSVRDLNVMFVWSGDIARKKKQLFYIPKMKPVRLKNLDKNAPEQVCDFTAGVLMPGKWNVNSYLTRKDCLDPDDVPDRFIRVSGDQSPELGIALGYSLISGFTAKKNKGVSRDSFYHLWRTKKMYPFAYLLNETRPGQVVESISYKQYFNPQLEPDATSFYWHREGDSWLVYLDFHKELKNKLIRFPQHLTGKKISVVEKTPSLTLHTGKTVPGEGILLDVSGKHGYLVLKLD